MTPLKFTIEKPGLLVSVRDASEALAALAGGADVIDVKEPGRGSLGAADGDKISAVVRVVNGRTLVSAAFGELVDLIDLPNGHAEWLLPSGVSLFKIGLAGCALLHDWQSHWQRAIDLIASSQFNSEALPVAVAYADWHDARAPAPHDVLNAAFERGCPALLIDTWNKSTGSLFDNWQMDDLRSFVAAVRSRDLAVVLAGSLAGDNIAAAARLAPDLIAVRTAACDSGRNGTVSADRVRGLKQSISVRPIAEFVRSRPGGM